jgi:sialate O-acetylesterase
MKYHRLLPAFLICITVIHARAEENRTLPLVNPMFGDHMVLQRGKPVHLWGWTGAGKAIRVELAGTSATNTAGPDGRWDVAIPTPAPGGPYEVMVLSPEQNITLHDVLVGDVWLCGGQSNMELPVSRSRDGEREIQAADHPDIRLFKVKAHPAYAPVSTAEGSWKVCSPQTIAADGGFSAVGYFFARKIQSETNVPIGLIQDCIGGTPAEAWTSPKKLHELKDFDGSLAEVERHRAQGGPEYGNYIMHWYDDYDAGLHGATWTAPDLNDGDWKVVTIPGGFRELGVADVPSVCYFRKTVLLPNPLPSGKAVIQLGVVERMDTTYINGQWVGASAWVENPRVYPINDGILKPGINEITVRVFKTKPEGGFESPPEKLRLVLGDGSATPLAGEWRGKLSVDARPPHPMPLGFENWPVMPGVLYNGMIAPVAPFGIRGAIWYQGEANTDRAFQYRTLLPAMITDWRDTFAQGDFPFYIVSLTAFMPHRDHPGDDAWAELREAQAMTARSVPNSGLAETIDIGDAANIHAADKQDVGDRLALLALAKEYGMDQPFSGPVFERAENLPGAFKLYFSHTDGGLIAKGEKPGEFSLAGADHKWFWADATIESNTVVVTSPQVPNPVAVRYAWQSNPIATLFNGAGLPAVPFRTDDWPGITAKAK